MMFQHPWVLAFIPLVAVLEWVRERPHRRLSAPFSDGANVTGLPASWAVRARRWLPWIHGAGLSLLLVAAARPLKGVHDSAIRTEGVDIVLVMDVSPSMAAEDFSTQTRRMNRLDAAKKVATEFVRRRTNDRMGLVAFAAFPYTLVPLTLDHNWLVERIGELRPGMLGDGTAIGSGLAAAVNRLRDSRAKSRVVILLTDGMNNSGSVAPDDAAQAAAALGVKVYTIGAGSRGVAPVPVRTPFGGIEYLRQPVEIDEELLQRIAAATGAMYFRATDLAGLEEIYRRIDQMEKTEIEAMHYTTFEERFWTWAAAGAVLLVIEKLLALTRLGVLPS